MLQVEKNIPIPPANKTGKQVKYPLDLLAEVGDSVFFEGSQKSISAVVSFARRKTGKDYAVRYGEKDGKKGARVWRVK